MKLALASLAVLLAARAARADEPPPVEAPDGPPIGDPDVKNTNDKVMIKRHLVRELPKLQYCYEKQLLANPMLSGTVVAHFTIAPTGAVTASTATGLDKDVASCVAGVIKAIAFDKLAGAGAVAVNYPLVFRSDTPPPPPPPGAKDAMSDDDRLAVRRAVKREIPKIQYCYEKQLLSSPALAGTVTAHFLIDATGKVTNSTADGMPKVDTCVADVIKHIAFAGITKATHVNYPFIFSPAASTPPPNTKVAGPADDKVMIRRVIKRHIPEIQYCYEKELLAKPDLKGTAVVEFVIAGDGTVSASAGKGLPPVDACVAAVIEKATFDKPAGGKPVPVSYPFVFQPGQ